MILHARIGRSLSRLDYLISAFPTFDSICVPIIIIEPIITKEFPDVDDIVIRNIIIRFQSRIEQDNIGRVTIRVKGVYRINIVFRRDNRVSIHGCIGKVDIRCIVCAFHPLCPTAILHSVLPFIHILVVSDLGNCYLHAIEKNISRIISIAGMIDAIGILAQSDTFQLRICSKRGFAIPFQYAILVSVHVVKD